MINEEEKEERVENANADGGGVEISASELENKTGNEQMPNTFQATSLREQILTFFAKCRSKEYYRNGLKLKWTQYVVFFAIIAIVLALDLVLKSVFDGKVSTFIAGLVSIDGNAHNTGAAFSMFSNATTALLIFSIIFVVLFLLYEFFTMTTLKGYLYYISFSLILGGTLGNLVDRLAFGYVRDFIRLEFVDFPIFNIADCALTIGVILLVVWVLFIEPRQAKSSARKQKR